MYDVADGLEAAPDAVVQCNLLSVPEMEGGKTPTTPTISSIIAGVQCQEAVETTARPADHQRTRMGLPRASAPKPTRSNISANPTASATKFSRRSSRWMRAFRPSPPESFWRRRGAGWALAHIWSSPAKSLKNSSVHNAATKSGCSHRSERSPRPRSFCPVCRTVRRDVKTFFQIKGDEDFLGLPLAKIGVPPFDIVIARHGTAVVGLEMGADAASVLGELAGGEALRMGVTPKQAPAVTVVPASPPGRCEMPI